MGASNPEIYLYVIEFHFVEGDDPDAADDYFLSRPSSLAEVQKKLEDGHPGEVTRVFEYERCGEWSPEDVLRLGGRG